VWSGCFRQDARVRVEQRWAASGVVVLLGAIWCGIALVGVTEPWRDAGPPEDSMGMAWVWLVSCVALAGSLVWLVLGLVTVRQVAAGTWSWRTPAVVGGLMALLSLLYAAGSLDGGPVWLVLLLGFQSVALFAWSVLLWTPTPPGGPGGTTARAAGDPADGARSA
jgi:hypothetical protein